MNEGNGVWLRKGVVVDLWHMRARVNLPEVRRGETAVLPMDRRVEGLVRAGKLQRLRRSGTATPVTRVRVTSGTIPEVLSWVGSDPERATAALAAEYARAIPRVTLVATLSAMAEQDDVHSDLSDESPDGHEDTGANVTAFTGALSEQETYVGIG